MPEGSSALAQPSIPGQEQEHEEGLWRNKYAEDCKAWAARDQEVAQETSKAHLQALQQLSKVMRHIVCPHTFGIEQGTSGGELRVRSLTGGVLRFAESS